MSRKFFAKIDSSTTSQETPEHIGEDEGVKISNFIFLPFNPRWELFVSVTILTNTVYTAFQLAYRLQNTFGSRLHYYACELVFFLTTCGIMLHCINDAHRRTRYHRKKPVILVTICFLSILPIYEVYYMIQMYEWRHEYHLSYLDAFTALKMLLRLIYASVYFYEVKWKVGVNDMFYVLYTHLFYGVCIVSAGTCLWQCSIYVNAYLHPNEVVETWVEDFARLHASSNMSEHMLVIGFYSILAFVTGGNSGFIHSHNSYETTLMLTLMAIGFFFQYVLFCGELLASFLRRQRHKFMFSSRLKKIIHLLDDWYVTPAVKKRTIDYYKVYWEKRDGVGTMPFAFTLLPHSLRKEVTVDIFWEAFKHSKLFAETDTSFKRSLSLLMKSEFLLPGDFVYRADAAKNKMVYIISGIVQIITEEDHDSPVLSLSGGTLLGELSILTMLKSRVNVRCDTYCEIQTLDIKAFYRVLLEYRSLTSLFRDAFQARIDYTKWATSDAVPHADVNIPDYKKRPMLTTLKKQWKRLMQLHRSKRIKDEIWRKLDKTFTSDYLDTMVICESQESDEHKICIKDTCPLVMQKDSSFRMFLEHLLLVAIIIEVVLLPYDIFFNRKFSYTTEQVLIPVDLIYYLDIYIQLSTSVKISPEVTLTEPIDIVKHRFKEVGFYGDLIAALPLNSACLLVAIDERTALVALCARIIKIKKLYAKFYRMEEQLFLHTLTVNTMKYLSMYMIGAYLCASLIYTIACFNVQCLSNSWFVEAMKADPKLNEESQVFPVVLFFAASLITGHHVTDFVLYNVTEFSLHIFIILASYVINAFMYAEMTATACMSHKETLEHQDDTAMFKIIVKKRNISPELRLRLLSILEFNWAYNEGAEIIGEKGILAEASQKIRSEVINERFIKCLREITLFENCPPALLEKLAIVAEVVILPSRTYIQNVDVLSHNIYIILRGYCEMQSMLPGDMERGAKIILKSGDVLALIETLHRIRMFGSIRTVTAVELLSISYETFIDAVQNYRTEYTIIHNALAQHMFTFETILMKKGCRLPEMKAPLPALGKVDTFRFKLLKGKVHKSYARDAFMKPFLQLGRWKWLRFFLLKKTINPMSVYYKIYEIFRCTYIIVDIVMLILSLSILDTYDSFYSWWSGLGHMLSLTDNYLRMHCQYYNAQGILVTHPLYTSYNYLKHAFLIDVMANLPISFLGVRQMFRVSQYEIELLITLALRCLALYRPFKGLSYIQDKLSWTGATFTLRVRHLIMTVIWIGVLSVILMSMACQFITNGKTQCSAGQFRLNSPFKKQRDSGDVYTQCLYIVTTVYTQRSIGLFYMVHKREIFVFIALMFVTHVTKAIFLAVYTSTEIGGNVNLSTHQARMRQFLTYAKNVVLDEKIVKEMIAHYEFVWRETLGTDINLISRKFNLYLRTQFVCFLYEQTLRNNNIFCNAPTAIVQRLLPMLKEEHYKKGAMVLRCNDVQKYVFLVHKGSVNISIASTTIVNLGIGGIFGCLRKTGITRQTIDVRANSHLTVLTVASSKFYEVMAEWDDHGAESMLKQIRTLYMEYIEMSEQFKTLTKSTIVPSEEWIKHSYYDKVIKKFNHYINQDGKFFHIYEYIVNVHLAPISTICIFAHAIDNPFVEPHYVFYMILYIIDIVFLHKLVLGFHLAINDMVTGFKIMNAKLIAINYLSGAFVLDVLSCLPLELITAFVLKEYTKLFTLNRTLRLLYMEKYYSACKNKLTVNRHLRWCFLIYTTLVKMELLVGVWYMVACINPVCKTPYETTGRPTGVRDANDTTISTFLSYTYVINMLTKGGLRDSIPINTIELAMSTFMAGYVLTTVAQLTGSYANITMIQNDTMDKYQYEIKRIKLYLRGRQLSPPIFRRVWDYLVQLWTLQQGEWMPYLVTFAPPYLKQDVMNFMYVDHLENHFLFSRTHVDFLRQMGPLFERRIYLPGNVIVEKGDVDHTMYFVHTGEVGAYERHGGNETQCFILRANTSFGEAQGMYGIPFQLCYKAQTVAVLLALQRDTWDYLLPWFPASNEEIQAHCLEYGLKDGKSYYYSGDHRT